MKGMKCMKKAGRILDGIDKFNMILEEGKGAG